MIGLTAGLTLLVGALGSTLVIWLPVIILATLGPAFTFSFFHWVWAKLNHMVGFKKDKGVEVFYGVPSDVSFIRKNGDFEYYKIGDISGYAMHGGYKRKRNKKGNWYTVSNGNLYVFYKNSYGIGKVYVKPKDGLEYWDDRYVDGDDFDSYVEEVKSRDQEFKDNGYQDFDTVYRDSDVVWGKDVYGKRRKF